jgi:hypothetical protein
MQQRHVGGHRTGAPGERHTRAAMAVVVNDGLCVELVGSQDEAGITMRAEADGGPNDAIE